MGHERMCPHLLLLSVDGKRHLKRPISLNAFVHSLSHATVGAVVQPGVGI